MHKKTRKSAYGEKSVARILAEHIFTYFNAINFALAAILFSVGSYRNMLFMGVVLSNLFIGVIQELRARSTVRKLRILNAPTAHVLRGNHEALCKAEELRCGDTVILRAGDQILADAVVTDGFGAVNEALLTGESEPVPKKAGSELLSGSFVAEGRITARLTCVGAESYAARITREAKHIRPPKSALMRDLNGLIRRIGAILIPLGVLLYCKQRFILGVSVSEAVTATAAAMLGMIPEGLILLTSIALEVGVIRLGRRNTLVKELYSIESLARTDVLCLDKTGTITTGRMTLSKLVPIAAKPDELREKIARYLGAFDEDSATLNALREAVSCANVAPSTAFLSTAADAQSVSCANEAPVSAHRRQWIKSENDVSSANEESVAAFSSTAADAQSVSCANEAPVAVLPFSSARKKSAVSFADGTTLILGAAEYVLRDIPDDLPETISNFTESGGRVLLFAEADGTICGDVLPPITKLLGLCVLESELRADIRDTVSYFREQGVEIKVLSGDDPRTASAIAKRAGIDGWERQIDASTIDESALAEAAEKYTVFGRLTPQKKKTLIEAMQRNGHSAAMVGDGINDLPAMRAADTSVAMANGADAARQTAQIALLNSDFASMPEIVLEGRRVINNITRSASLFLTKTLFSFALTLLTLIFPNAYPFQPIQLTLISALTIGAPSFVLALEPDHAPIRGSFLRSVLKRAIPGAAAVTVSAALAMLGTRLFGWETAACSTVATLAAGFAGLCTLFNVCRPFNRLRLALLAAMTAAFYGAALLFGELFMLTKLNPAQITFLLALMLFCASVIFLFGAKKQRHREK